MPAHEDKGNWAPKLEVQVTVRDWVPLHDVEEQVLHWDVTQPAGSQGTVMQGCITSMFRPTHRAMGTTAPVGAKRHVALRMAVPYPHRAEQEEYAPYCTT
jgi:hypothetical protein